jgi:hypothetical protein
MKQTWTKQDIQKLPAAERPMVRCELEIAADHTEGRAGKVFPDVNPWVEIWGDGNYRCEQFSWELVLQVLNDDTVSPIWFWRK